MRRYQKASALAAAGAAALLCACAHQGEYVWVDEVAAEEANPLPYAIQPGDNLNIAVWNQINLSGPARVRMDGKVTVPLLGDVLVAGYTAPDAAASLTKLLAGLVLSPRVTVAVLEARPPAVSVVGEVKAPGSFPLVSRDTVLDLLAKAGGLSEFADDSEIYLIRERTVTKKPLRVRFDYERLAGALGRGIAFPLQDGDIIVVR